MQKPSWIFNRVLNMLLNCLPNIIEGPFILKSTWITYQEKAKRKNKTNLLIYKFLNLTLRSQTLANIHKIFQNIYHIDPLYILGNSAGSSFSTPYTCLIFRIAPINVLYNHNRNLMGHFKFLHGMRMICLP